MVTNHRRARSLLVVLATATALAAAPAVAYADSSRPAPVTGGIPLVNTSEKIGPGIGLQHVKAVDQKGWYDAQFLTVDLSNSAVGTDLLSSGPVASGGPLSEAVNKAGAVAGVNGDFFDIGNSNAALGGEIQNGQLVKTADISGGRKHVGVSKDGVAQLVDLTVDTTAKFAGADHKVSSINAANVGGIPADGMVAFTPAWGTYSRNSGLTGVANDQIAEVLVKDGAVVSVTPSGPAGSGAIPDGGFVLVGRGAAASAIRALQPGDPATLSHSLADNVAKTMQFAIGHGGTIVSGGQPVKGLDTSIAPRTALGFKDGGKTLVLATWDGPGGTGKGGIGIDKEARDLAAMGVETAVNLDGGGSSTMVARGLGDDDATVRNVPSDGHERNDPNGVGVFVSKGDGRLHQLLVKPAPGAASADGDVKVFPGLHRALAAEGIDNHQTPVTVDPDSVRWSSREATVDGAVLTAPQAHGPVTVDAEADGVQGHGTVSVLGPLTSVEPSSQLLSIAGVTPDDATTVAVTGRDAEGYTAPIEPQDLSLDYDHDVVGIKAVDGRLRITPLANASTILKITAGGVTARLPITIGVQTRTVYDFDDDVLARWRNNSTAATTFSTAPEGLRIDFNAMRNVGITSASSAQRVSVPGQPLRLRVRLKSSISVPGGLTYIAYTDSAGKGNGSYGTGLNASSDWQYATFQVPADTKFPIAISGFQGINTSVAQQKAGTFVLDRIEADVPTSIDLPAQPDLRPDALVSDDGSLLKGSSTWQFATLSDVQFTADNPALTQVATAAIQRIRTTHPDLLVLNGDITDRGLPQDLTLARQVLTDAGCDLIPVGQEPAPDSTPDPNAGSIPCYYVPGNHESYGLNNVQQDLTNFTAEFGRPYRTFDHKGTRFILLASSVGSLRGTAWDQLPMLRQALADAKDDTSVDNVAVFAHHPVDDPAETKSSQLGDRDEAALIEHLLTDFRDDSGKGAVMVGSHAQIADVHHLEGVPYMVLPSSGKDPYGTPDRGGFTGWVDWSVDSHRNARQQWLQADVRAFAQSITLNTPESVEAGRTAQLSGSIVQPQGVGNGSRVVPLRYPMSVHWSGSSNLAIGTGKDAVDDARRKGKVAILDPRTRVLTALKAGSVTVTVTNDSMRAYTDGASLAPVTTSKTVQVVPAQG
ncbi:phosphodiester glycosidase family protein [Streptomyces sp. NPDC088354]|uniref:phosphodiester glycosidase family protein n=1 Tax=Streptomyces sp. NPDC088354 TaxID=3365856 RepID=UPI0037F41107